MNTEIAIRRHGFGLTSDEFETMQRMARAMVASNYFSDVKDVAQAIVKIQAGSELGIPPFAALTGIHIIKNKPVLGANLIATLIKNDPRYNYKVATLNDETCVIEFYEDGEQVGESKFTMSDAKQAGIIKSNWNKYPRNMLFARAISNGARWYTPGIFSGATIYTPEEMGADVDEEGNVVTVEQPPEPVPTNGEQPAEQGEFDEIDEPSGDSGPAASPQAQAKRERPKAEPDNDIDWKARATGQKFTTFASCLVNAGVGYSSEEHVENALGTIGEEWDPDESDRLWDALVERKAEKETA